MTPTDHEKKITQARLMHKDQKTPLTEGQLLKFKNKKSPTTESIDGKLIIASRITSSHLTKGKGKGWLGVVASNISILEGQGWWITLGQEFKTSLANM